MKTTFKSIRKIAVTTERGTDFMQCEGTVTAISKDIVAIKGIMFDFCISKSDFLKFNVK